MLRINGIDTTSPAPGPAVLLLHGFPHTWRLWRRISARWRAPPRHRPRPARSRRQHPRPAAMTPARSPPTSTAPRRPRRTDRSRRRHRRRRPRRRSCSPCDGPNGSVGSSSWNLCWVASPAPKTSSPAGRPGGSASTPSPVSPKRSSPGTKPTTSTGSSTRAPAAAVCRPKSATLSSPPTPDAMPCGARSPTTAPCQPAPPDRGRRRHRPAHRADAGDRRPSGRRRTGAPAAPHRRRPHDTSSRTAATSSRWTGRTPCRAAEVVP